MQENTQFKDKINNYVAMPFFNDLPKSTLNSINNVAVYRSYIPGKYITTEGKSCQAAYLILRGSVNVFRVSANGRKLVILRLGPGDWFNAISCFRSEDANPYSVRARTPVKVMMLTGSDFRRLVQTQSSFAIKIMESISERSERLIDKIENIALRSTSGRVAHFLLEHADDSDMIHWQCTQKDIADRLGTVADVVGRVLRKFADDGIIEMPIKHCIVIVDKKKLEQEALK